MQFGVRIILNLLQFDDHPDHSESESSDSEGKFQISIK